MKFLIALMVFMFGTLVGYYGNNHKWDWITAEPIISEWEMGKPDYAPPDGCSDWIWDNNERKWFYIDPRNNFDDKKVEV